MHSQESSEFSPPQDVRLPSAELAPEDISLEDRREYIRIQTAIISDKSDEEGLAWVKEHGQAFHDLFFGIDPVFRQMVTAPKPDIKEINRPLTRYETEFREKKGELH